MAEYLITGGGSALDDALNFRNDFNYTNGDILRVGPGIYSPINFAKYLQNVEVRSTDGKEVTIIDGQGTSTCLKNRYNKASYPYQFYGFTLRNGFISSDISAPANSAAGIMGAIELYDCNIYDCSAVNLYDPWYDPYNGAGAIASQSYSATKIYNCDISGNVGDMFPLIRMGSNRLIYGCDIHDNVSTAPNRGDRFSLISMIERCKIHDNLISGLLLGPNNTINTLIYNNKGTSSNNWLGERTMIINCVIANNIGFALENGSGQATYWKNNVVFGNRRTNGNYVGGTFYGYSGRSQVWNCYFDQLSTSVNWSGWNELSGNRLDGSVFIQDADFGFVDPANGDFRLRPDSMLIGKGTWEILSGKTPTGTTLHYDGTEANEWLSANGDFTSRPWKDPPSVGAYEYIKDKQNLPNKLYPMGKGLDIPSWMTRIAYLESTGTQWIDLGPNVPLNGYVSFDATLTAVPAGAGIWGQQVSGTRILVYFRSMSVGFFEAGTYATIDFSTLPNAAVVNQQYGNSASDIVPRYIFTTVNSNGTPRTTRVRAQLRSFSIKDENGVPFCDLVPVRIDQIGYLYDRVTQQLFGNQGTGSFVLGPDI